MMQTSVPISEDILQWVMTRVRLESLPQKVAANLTKWSKKEKTPTFNQIEDVSRATGIPLGYFFLKTPPQEDLTLVEYRTVDSVELINPSRELIDTMHNMELVQDWMHEQLLAEGTLELPFVGAQNENTGIDDFVVSVRETLNLKIDWFMQSGDAGNSFSRLRTAMSVASVIVMTK